MADPFSSWSPEESGVRLAERDAIFRNLKGLEAQRLMGEIAQQPADLQARQAQAKMWGAKAEEAAQKARSAERLETEVSQGGPLPEGVEALYDLSQRAQRAGHPEAAAKYIDLAGKYVENLAKGEQAIATVAKNQAEAAQKQRDEYTRMLSTVTDQPSLDRVNAQHQATYGAPGFIQRYNPDDVKRFQDTQLTATDRLNAQLRQIEERGRNWGRAILDRHNRATEDLRRDELARRKAKDDLDAKAGGRGAVGKPTDRDREAVGRLLKEYRPNLSGTAKSLAEDSIASRALEIMRANRGIGRDAAVQQAYNESVEFGDFVEEDREVMGVRRPLGMSLGSTQTFRGGGRSSATAIETPLKAGRPELEKLQAGRWYRTPAGPRKYVGNGRFEPESGDTEE